MGKISTLARTESLRFCSLLLAILILASTACDSRLPGAATAVPSDSRSDKPADQPQEIDPNGPGPIKPGRPNTNVLRLHGAEPDTLDPAKAQDVTSWVYMLQIFSGLVRLDNNLQVVPDIAKEWKTDSTGTVYTFALRSDVKFHDGRQVTADDIKFSLERSVDRRLGLPSASLYLGDILGVAHKLAGKASEISGVRIIDPNTIQITIDAPKSYFLAKLTYPTAFVLDHNNVRSSDWWKHPNGTGPFKLQEWRAGEELVFAANESYYGEKPKVAQVSYFLGPGSSVVMFEREELDVAPVGPADIDRVLDRRNPLNAEVVVAPQLNLWYLGFNVNAKPFDDPKVRQAFHLATDKQRIVEILLRNTRLVAEGILPPGMPGYDKAFRGPAFDAAKAKDLLARSSYGGANILPPITLTVGSGGGRFGESLAEMYAANLGVQINVEETDKTFFEDLNARKYQFFYIGWYADYPDPQDFMDILFHASSEGNHTGYGNSQVDRLLERARLEPNEQRRFDLYREAERLVVGDAPVVPLFHDVDYVLVNRSVKGLVWTPVGLISLNNVSIQIPTRPGTL